MFVYGVLCSRAWFWMVGTLWGLWLVVCSCGVWCLLAGFGLLWFVAVGGLILVVLILVFSAWLGGWFGLRLSVVGWWFVGLCRFEGLWI